MTKLTDKIFNDEDAAREHLERLRWPDGPVCPHCGNADKEAIKRLEGKSHRPGLYQCNACREHFTVTVGSVMERSHIPLPKWVLAFHLMASSKKGMSAHQLHRSLGITYKSAWFLAHRVREAMRPAGSTPIGGEGKVVEADETYFGKKEVQHTHSRKTRKELRQPQKSNRNNRAVVALVERGGNVRSFHPAFADKVTVEKIVRDNIARESRLMTDESRLYNNDDNHFAGHETVKHSAYEYVRGDVHSNTVEGYFSILKRGMRGVYQHCKEKHLHRYLAEFDFRYNHRVALGYNDGERADIAIVNASGKRLTYRQSHQV